MVVGRPQCCCSSGGRGCCWASTLRSAVSGTVQCSQWHTGGWLPSPPQLCRYNGTTTTRSTTTTTTTTGWPPPVWYDDAAWKSQQWRDWRGRQHPTHRSSSARTTGVRWRRRTAAGGCAVQTGTVPVRRCACVCGHRCHTGINQVCTRVELQRPVSTQHLVLAGCHAAGAVCVKSGMACPFSTRDVHKTRGVFARFLSRRPLDSLSHNRIL